MRRIGWWFVLAAALVAAGANLVILGARTVRAVADGSAGDALGSLPLLVLAGLFWRWVLRDVWERARPKVDPYTGDAAATSEQVGSWGVVGRLLLAAMVLGSSLLAWGATEMERDERPARRAAERAEVSARRNDLTYDQVARIVDSHRSAADATGSRQASKELDGLLDVEGARVVDVAVGEAGTAIFLRPIGGPPCGVLVIDRDDLRSTRTATSC